MWVTWNPRKASLLEKTQPPRFQQGSAVRVRAVATLLPPKPGPVRGGGVTKCSGMRGLRGLYREVEDAHTSAPSILAGGTAADRVHGVGTSWKCGRSPVRARHLVTCPGTGAPGRPAASAGEPSRCPHGCSSASRRAAPRPPCGGKAGGRWPVPSPGPALCVVRERSGGDGIGLASQARQGSPHGLTASSGHEFPSRLSQRTRSLGKSPPGKSGRPNLPPHAAVMGQCQRGRDTGPFGPHRPTALLLCAPGTSPGAFRRWLERAPGARPTFLSPSPQIRC